MPVRRWQRASEISSQLPSCLENHHGEVIRYALLSGHYRQSLLFEDRLLEQATSSLHSLYTARRRAEDELSDSSFQSAPSSNAEDYPTAVLEALADDLNTPVALSVLHGIATDLNKSEDTLEIKRLHRELVYRVACSWVCYQEHPLSIFKHLPR